MPCESTRPQIRPPGWTCDGTNLVQFRNRVTGVVYGARNIPAVIRSDLTGRLDAGTAAVMTASTVEQFPGGDHFHIVVLSPGQP